MPEYIIFDYVLRDQTNVGHAFISLSIFLLQFFEVHRKKLQEKTQENPYFTLNYQENSGFPVVFFLEFFSTSGVFWCFSTDFLGLF